MKETRLSKNIRKWSVDKQKERWERRPLLLYPDALPILQIKDAIIKTIKEHQTLIIAAETGSGKSTQLPKMLLEAGVGKHGKIACVQPRRIAATSIAKRIAYELKEPLGESVGYRIRFDDRSSTKTFIQVMTDGMLLSELHHDPYLWEYDAVIIDEAHERSLNIDLLLGLLKKILLKRAYFKILIASATIDTQRFSQFFYQAPILLAKGRHYDVEIRYQEAMEKDEDILEQALRALQRISEESTTDDVLIFLPTEDFIKNFIELAKKAPSKEKRIFLPLYARLSPSEQQRIFEDVDGRKVIVATNIAETSITLPNIRYVIDSGMARINQYSAQSRIQNLPIVAISQASANQRAGRCGRVSNGVAIRLYSESDFHARSPHTEPEIKRANLTETILRMMAMNIREPEHFELIDQPHSKLFNEGFKTLFELQAIPSLKKSERQLTSLGKAMSHLPLDPRLSRMLLAANEEGALEEVTIIAAALSVMDLRSVPEDKRNEAKVIHQTFHSPASDLLWYLNLYKVANEKKHISQNQLKRFCQAHYLHYMRVHEWLSLKDQMSSLLKERGYKHSELGMERVWHTATSGHLPIGYVAIHRAVLSGYLSQIGVYQPAEESVAYSKNNKKQPVKRAHYLNMRMQEFTLFPTSSLVGQNWPWIFATKMWRTSQLFAREVATLDSAWLVDLAKHLIQVRASLPVYSTQAQEVVCTETHYLYSYPIAQYPNRSYYKYNPQQATLLFITQALTQADVVEPFLAEELFGFLRHNMALQQEIEASQAKLRRDAILIDEEALVKFYLERMKGIASMVALRKKIQQNPQWQESLYLQESDLMVERSLLEELAQLPSEVVVEQNHITMEYRFAPNTPEDGVTAILTPRQVVALSSDDALLWQPAGLFMERLTAMIKQLSKSDRMKLHPTNPSVKRIAKEITREGNLFEALQLFCQQNMHIVISKEHWQEAYDKIEERLKIHFAVRYKANDEEDLARSPRLDRLKTISFASVSQDDFTQLSEQWYMNNLTTWPEKHLILPKVVDVHNSAGEVYSQAYPALVYDEAKDQINLALFTQQTEAQSAHIVATSKLLSRLLKQEITFMKKNFAFKERDACLRYWGNYKEANRYFEQYIQYNYFYRDDIYSCEAFLAYDTTESRQHLWQEVAKDFTLFGQTLEQYAQLRERITKAKAKESNHAYLELLRENLDFLAGKEAWTLMSQAKLRRLPALLKIWQRRFERALAHLAKDKERSLEWRTYHQKIKEQVSLHLDGTALKRMMILSHLLYEVELKSFVSEAPGLLFSKKELEELWITL